MTEHHVHLREHHNDKHTIVFNCEADNFAHAEEQALNAYPSGKIILIFMGA
jgi:hypothetical protein